MEDNFIVFKSIPFQLLLITICSFVFGSYIPLSFLSFFLTVSLIIKSILLFLLPFIIFGLVFYSFSNISGSTFLFTGLLLGLVCCSNFMATIFSYVVTLPLKDYIRTTIQIKNCDALKPLFDVPIFQLHEKINLYAIITAIALGIYSSKTNRFKIFAQRLSKVISFLLSKVFIKVLPIFVLGFILKLYKDGTLFSIFKHFGPLSITILIAQWSYITFGYFCASSFKLQMAKDRIKNIFPACIVGFSTMSSAITLPTLINRATLNAKDKSLVGSVIPSVINSHMLGDAIAIPIMAISILSCTPSFNTYISFALAFMINKFAAAGIPGGTIIIMIPILEEYLGFTSEMSGLIFTMYVLFDCICTMASIYGNGLYMLVFEKIWTKVRKVHL